MPQPFAADNGLGREDLGAALATSGASVTFTPVPFTGLKVAYGQHTTQAASDTVATGLATVLFAIASLESDPGDDPFMCDVAVGDQAGAPAAGSILVKTWKFTSGVNDVTPIAATTFTKKVNWIAFGT